MTGASTVSMSYGTGHPLVARPSTYACAAFLIRSKRFVFCGGPDGTGQDRNTRVPAAVAALHQFNAEDVGFADVGLLERNDLDLVHEFEKTL